MPRLARAALRPTFSLLLAAALALPLGGCFVHRHRIGLGPSGIGEESARQVYLFFGLIRVNEVDPQRMAKDLTSYEIESGYEFMDILLAPILLPLTMTSRTVTVRT